MLIHSMTRERALTILREHEAELKAKGVAHLRLFGSVARDEATETSDVDVIVDFDPGMRVSLLTLGGLWGDLHQMLGTDIDLVSESGLRDHLRQHVLSEAVRAF